MRSNWEGVRRKSLQGPVETTRGRMGVAVLAAIILARMSFMEEVGGRPRCRESRP